MGWIFAALGAALACMVLWTIYRGIVSVRKLRQQAAMPVVECRAVLEEKLHQVTTHRSLVSSLEPDREEVCTAVFRLEDDSQLVFAVSQDLFYWMESGQRGLLRYQGERFLDFSPEGTDWEADEEA